MAVGDRKDPYRAYNYRVELDGVDVAGFSEASGLTFDIDMVEYREGSDRQMHVRKLAGLRKFSNITLKRGYTQSDALYSLYFTGLNGALDRRDGAIILQDEDRNDVLRWNFYAAWITKYEGPAFNATSNDIAIESLELCVERVEMEVL